MADRPATLVLAGGGARGAFQVGAERVLREQGGFRWTRVFGISVGAPNATLIAQGEYARLYQLWRNALLEGPSASAACRGAGASFRWRKMLDDLGRAAAGRAAAG